MWQNIKHDKVFLEKVVAEFDVYLDEILPNTKMKAIIVENPKMNGYFLSYNNIQIRQKYNSEMFEGAVGYGETVEEALKDLVKYFFEMVDENYPQKNYPNGIPEEDIEYADWWSNF